MSVTHEPHDLQCPGFLVFPFLPVLYHTSPTPLALIVSPRDRIVQLTNISVLPTLTLDEQIKREDEVSRLLDVSTLVVPIGGVGVYPTMVMETTDLRWVLDTVAHEWTHNYLTVRPLGLNYSTTPELRTMNETTASIVGDDVGKYVLKKYYPELYVPPPSPSASQSTAPPPTPDPNVPPPFDFRAEMHETRVRADELLSQGKIEEAEAYMDKINYDLYFLTFSSKRGVLSDAGGKCDFGESIEKTCVREFYEESCKLFNISVSDISKEWVYHSSMLIVCIEV